MSTAQIKQPQHSIQNVVWVRCEKDHSLYIPLTLIKAKDHPDSPVQVVSKTTRNLVKPLILHRFVTLTDETNFQNLSVELVLEVFSWLTPSELYSVRYLTLNRMIYDLLMGDISRGTSQRYWYQLIEQAKNCDPVCLCLLPVIRSLECLLSKSNKARNDRSIAKIQFHQSASVHTSMAMLSNGRELEAPLLESSITLSWDDIGLNQLFVQAKQTHSMIQFIWNRIESFVSIEVKRNLRRGASGSEIETVSHLLYQWHRFMDRDSDNRKLIESIEGSKKYCRTLGIPLDLYFSLNLHDGEDTESGVMLGGITSENGLSSVLGFTRLLSIEEIKLELELQWKNQLQEFCQIDGLCLLPVTTKMGGSQLCINVMKNVVLDNGKSHPQPVYKFGEVYLVNGWNVFKKADSWLHYLYGLMDIPLHAIQFPIVL